MKFEIGKEYIFIGNHRSLSSDYKNKIIVFKVVRFGLKPEHWQIYTDNTILTRFDIDSILGKCVKELTPELKLELL